MRQEPWEEPVAADRLLLFSDAVFAISATLLLMDIRVSAGLGPAQFSQTLREQLPAIAAYALSFAVSGQLWLFHHRIFAFVARVDTHIVAIVVWVLLLSATVIARRRWPRRAREETRWRESRSSATD